MYICYKFIVTLTFKPMTQYFLLFNTQSDQQFNNDFGVPSLKSSSIQSSSNSLIIVTLTLDPVTQNYESKSSQWSTILCSLVPKLKGLLIFTPIQFLTTSSFDHVDSSLLKLTLMYTLMPKAESVFIPYTNSVFNKKRSI